MSDRPILFAIVPALAAMMSSATLGADELPPRALAHTWSGVWKLWPAVHRKRGRRGTPGRP
jgi:hypothetical protein